MSWNGHFNHLPISISPEATAKPLARVAGVPAIFDHRQIPHFKPTPHTLQRRTVK
jgi:hypothetical protein